jgi:AcrR family transcriptional regulator
LLNKHGQSLKPKGLETRRRLLETAASLLNKGVSLDTLSAPSVARAAGMSPAAFYIYFNDMQDLLLELTSETLEKMGDLVRLLSTPWSPHLVHSHAEAFVEAFHQYWYAHHGILVYSIFAINNGDKEVARLRLEASYPVIRALAKQMLALHVGTEELGPVSSVARANLLWSGMQQMTASVFAARREPSATEVLDPLDLKRAEVDTLVKLMLPHGASGRQIDKRDATVQDQGE